MSNQLKVTVSGGSLDERMALATFVRNYMEYAGIKLEMSTFPPAPISLVVVRQASLFTPVKIGVQDNDHELEVNRIV